jgi:dienelactone hydrolase
MQITQVPYFDDQQKLIGTFFENPQKPTLILFPAFEGFSDFAKDYAKTLFDKGFQVFIADMYGEQFAGKTLDDCFSKISPFLEDRALVRKRANLAFDAVKNLPSVDKNQIGAFGFCFGGMCALELARSGVDLKGCVTIHGILKKSDLTTQKVNSKILICHGLMDPQVPFESLMEFAEEMQKASNNDFRFLVFGDAKHSFSDPKTGTFDPVKEKQMGRAFNKKAAVETKKQLTLFFNELFFEKTF